VGLLAPSVGVGLGVLEELMVEEVEEVCGPRGRHDPDRVAYRHGSDDGEVTLGGRRVAVQRFEGAHQGRRWGAAGGELRAVRFA
jgi:putative transposase